MRILIFTFSLFLVTSTLVAQNAPLDAEASDPNIMGWMLGFRPADNKIVSGNDGSFFQFPAMRYSVCHMRQFMTTTNVPSAQKNRYEFKLNLDDAIDALTFTPWHTEEKMTWETSLGKNYTDGIIILHKGEIVYEKYFGALKPDGIHAVMSVSKTLTGTLGALLVDEGVLDENKTAGYYVPELKKSAFGDATIREILDMTTALQYSEDYSNPKAEVYTFSNAKYYYDYLETVTKNGVHGEVFSYKTINTDAMGWIASRTTGKSIPELLSTRIWKPLGTHFDGYYSIDDAAIAFAGGGFNANLRDLAMFGEMIRNDGYFNNQQVLPKSVIDNIKEGGSQQAFEEAGYKDLKNWSYRNMWWITHNEHGAFAARGVYGQTIYIDPKAEMVLVRLASHPEAKNAKIDPTSLPAYHAVAKYLLSK
ncbi:serine hydrolase [Snuella lapsa]|uniref:Serine hydrolase n=1 Tax=Snuella lapsa TaxID=870481 RepID=A0ABP6XRF5_9FLAO